MCVIDVGKVYIHGGPQYYQGNTRNKKKIFKRP